MGTSTQRPTGPCGGRSVPTLGFGHQMGLVPPFCVLPTFPWVVTGRLLTILGFRFLPACVNLVPPERGRWSSLASVAEGLADLLTGCCCYKVNHHHHHHPLAILCLVPAWSQGPLDLPAALRRSGMTSPTSTLWRHGWAGNYRSAPGAAATFVRSSSR
eukprot:365970-Chlamydomonas_euryale.AAC.14